MNLHTGEYDGELLALFGLSQCADKLPPLRNSTDICGYITKEAAEKPGFPRERLWLAALLTSMPARWAWVSPIPDDSV